MVFLITGLQARALIANLGGYPISELVLSAAIVSGVVIAARFIWVYPAIYLPRWLVPAIQRKDPAPPWQSPFALAFTGIRGIVSLAAALAIPFTTASGAPFPHRDLILFLTFSVILVTLVGQGLTLPLIIRALGFPKVGRRERHADRAEEFAAREQAVTAAIERLDQLMAENHLTEEVVHPLRAYHRDRLKQIASRYDGDDRHKNLVETYDALEFQLIAAERKLINDLYRAGKLKDDARRRIERELDLRDAQLSNLLAEE